MLLMLSEGMTGRDGCDFTLDDRFLEKLRGLQLGEISEDVWGELIEAIEEHDEIRVKFAY